MIRIESEKNPPVAVLNYVSPLYLRNEEYENRSKRRIIDWTLFLTVGIYKEFSKVYKIR